MTKPIPPGDQSVAWKGTVVGADDFAPPPKKSRAKWAVIGVGGALAVGIAAYALWPSSSTKPAATTPADAGAAPPPAPADASAPPIDTAAPPVDAAAAPLDAPDVPDKLVQPAPKPAKKPPVKKKPVPVKKKH